MKIKGKHTQNFNSKYVLIVFQFRDPLSQNILKQKPYSYSCLKEEYLSSIIKERGREECFSSVQK